MGKIISLSGCRSIGKTTLIKGLKENMPELITREGFRRTNLGLNMEIEEEYYDNERWYFKREIDEFDEVKQKKQDAIFLRGPEDLEFYALHYPITKGKQWNVEEHLVEEMKSLRKRRSDYILYLTASEETIWNRCINDEEKKRNNLREWMEDWEPYFDKYMMSLDNVVVLNTDELSANDVLEWTINWMKEI